MTENELEKLFSHGSGPWSVKYYSSRVLTGLTSDLSRRTEVGLPQEVCDQVYAALNRAVDLVEDIKDGGFFFKNFYETLEEFRDLYRKWNNVKDKYNRIKLHAALKKRKKNMFKRFFKKMKKLKTKENEARIKQFEILWEIEAVRMDELNYTFSQLVKNHGEDIFIDLKRSLDIFNKN